MVEVDGRLARPDGAQRQLRLPDLPAEVATELTELRRLRNQIAHTGRPKRAIQPPQAARCFAAAIFGYEYVAMLQMASAD